MEFAYEFVYIFIQQFFHRVTNRYPPIHKRMPNYVLAYGKDVCTTDSVVSAGCAPRDGNV